MAVILDARYSKDEILEAYLNEIYLGRRGSIAITGVGEAARHYFGKEVADLDLAESATLAGMIKAPNAYSPFRNPERAMQRRDLVLQLMREEGKIDDAALRAALAEPVTSRAPASTIRTKAPHFVDFVKGELAERYGQQLKTEGLQIYTTLDVDLQQAGQRAVTRGPRRTREEVPAARAGVEGGAAPGRAHRRSSRRRARVRALVGGRDYRALAVQPRDAGAPAAGQPLQAVRLSRRLLAPRPADPPVTPATILRGLADHRRVGPEDRRGAVDAAQLRRRLPRADVGAPGARALDQHPDGARRRSRRGSPTCSAPRRRRGSARGCGPIPPSPSAPSRSRRWRSPARTPSSPTAASRVAPNAIVGVMTGDGTVLDRKATALHARAAGRRRLPRGFASCAAPSTAARPRGARGRA